MHDSEYNAPIFSDFLILSGLISRSFRRVEWKQNIISEECIGYISQDERAIASWSLLSANSSFINGIKEVRKQKGINLYFRLLIDYV